MANRKFDEQVDGLFEKDLVTYCSARIVKYLRLVYVESDGKQGYELWAKCKFSKHELLLLTHNTREPRLWASLDRAIKHFREKYHYRGQVVLEI
jgi:hypothetical protein